MREKEILRWWKVLQNMAKFIYLIDIFCDRNTIAEEIDDYKERNDPTI